MERTPLEQLEDLFDDLALLDGPVFDWVADQEQLPVTVTLQFFPDGPYTNCVFTGDAADFASRAQALLIPYYNRPAPRCPHHGMALTATASRWSCADGDWACDFGRYHELQWPPISTENAAVVLTMRFQRRGVTGLSHWGVQRREGRLVAEVYARGGDEKQLQAIHAAAAPIAADITVIPDIVTTCTEDDTYRSIEWTGGTHHARKEGPLHRAPDDDSCDFLVGDTRVRFKPDHRIGPPGDAVVLCADGRPIGYEGETVILGGGWVSEGNPHLAGVGRIFSSGHMTVVKRQE